MQTVSSTFTTDTSAATQTINYGILIAWTEQINPSYAFFTIGTSLIGGPDVIKGGGAEVTFLDRYQYTDYSAYGISIDIKRGLGQYPYGTVMGQAEVKLDNTDLSFMPGHDPTIGNYILPNRPVKLSAGFGTESITTFAGYSTAPLNDVNHRETSLLCYDGMNYLNMFPSKGAGPVAAANNGAYINMFGSDIIADLLQEAGFSSTEYVIEQSLQPRIGYLAPINFQTGTNVGGNQGSIGYIISAICESEMGIAFFDEAGIFHYWNRQHIPDHNTIQWTFDYSETVGGNNTGIINYGIENTAVINDVIVQSTPRVVAARQLVWQLAQPTLIPAGGSVIVSADFSDSYGTMPVTALDTPVLFTTTTPPTSTYQVNVNSDGSDPLGVGSFVSVTSTVLNGSNAQITFHNTYSQPIYVTQMGLYGTPATVTQVITQEFKNQTSINQYGINPANNGQPLTITNDLIQDNSSAYSIAYQLVTDYATPFQRMTLEVMAVPQLQFGDYVTVTLDDTGQTLNYTVINIELSQTKEDPLKQTVEVEVRQMINYFTIGVSTIGGTDSIAP